MHTNSETTHETSGVELTKHYDNTDRNLPSVVFNFSSNRSEPVSIRVVEPIADELDPSHIGLQTGDTREEWTLRETDIVLELELEASDEYETAYALRPEQSYDPDTIIVEPAVFEVTPTESASNLTGDFTRSTGTHDTGQIRATDGSGIPATTGETADNGGGSPNEISRRPPSSQRTETEKEKHDGESLVDQLAAELEDGAGSAESREYLQTAFEMASDSGSTDAQIRQLQADLSDFRAYTNALEEFLDDNGSARELIADFETRMDSFDEEVTSLEAELQEQDDAISAVRGENEQIQDELEAINSDIESLTESVDELRDDLSSLDSRVPDHDVGERMSEIEKEMTDLSEFMADLKSVFGGGDS